MSGLRAYCVDCGQVGIDSTEKDWFLAENSSTTGKFQYEFLQHEIKSVVMETREWENWNENTIKKSAFLNYHDSNAANGLDSFR